VAKLNTDASPDIAVQFNISGIPAVLIFNGGKEVNRQVGVQPQAAYERVLDGLVGAS
jgi:thioredoxin 1